MKGVKRSLLLRATLKKKNSYNWGFITHRRTARLDEEGGCRWRVLAFVCVLFCLAAELSSNKELKFNLLKLTVFVPLQQQTLE